MDQKLPGYDQAQKLIRLYQKAGFTNQEILEQLANIEELIFAELVAEVEEGMSEADKKQFDKFLDGAPSPEEIAKFLKLDRETLAKKIEGKIQKLIDELTEDLTKAELSLEKLKSAHLNLQLPKEQKLEVSSQETKKTNQPLLQRVLSKLFGA